MCCFGVFKRVVPFFITFAAGLFIASFFITIAAPSFPASRRQVRMRENQRLKIENDELRRDNCRLKRENEVLRDRDVTVQATESLGDVDVFAVPPPPPVPTVTRPATTRTIK